MSGLRMLSVARKPHEFDGRELLFRFTDLTVPSPFGNYLFAESIYAVFDCHGEFLPICKRAKVSAVGQRRELYTTFTE